jgi:medium-chain acyl-[acyl-carrier-protein] hydrolase
MDAVIPPSVSSAAWFLCPRPNPNARMRLFCLPFAGGGASTYHGWPHALPGEIEMRAVQLPGREARLGEPRARSARALAQSIAGALEPYLERPFALFGYSMGALLAFETARELRRRGRPLPIHLFVAAMRAPHLPGKVPPLASLSQEELLRGVRHYYQPPEEAFQIPELLELFLPVLRDDIALVDAYAYYDEPPLSCAIDAYVGEDDRSTDVDSASLWGRHGTGPFALDTFPGGHFFLQGALPQLQRKVAARLRSLIGAPG